MKKLISIFVLLALSCSIQFTCFASEPDKELSTTKVIELEDRTLELRNNATGKIDEIYLKEGTKTITTTVIDKSNSVNKNVMTVQGTFYIPEESEPAIVPLGETESGSRRDITASVEATLTIEFLSRIDARGDYWYLLENVSGDWLLLDNAMTLSNKNVYYGCSSSLPPVTQADMDTNISGDSFDIDTNFEIYVCEKAKDALIGAKMQADITRTSNTWTFPFSEYLVGN